MRCDGDRKFITRGVLIWGLALSALLLISAPLYAYECVDKATAQWDYDAAKRKIKIIQKERTKFAAKDRLLAGLGLRKINIMFALLSAGKAKVELDKTHEQEDDAAFRKWFGKTYPHRMEPLRPSQVGEGTIPPYITEWYRSEEHKQFEKDFTERYKELIDPAAYRATLQEVAGERDLQLTQYYAWLDLQQDKWLEILRAANDCLKGLSRPPAVAEPGPFFITVDPHGPPRYVKANEQVHVEVLISGGTPPYNLTLTSAVHNIRVNNLSESAASDVKIPLQFPQPGTYQVTVVVEDSSLPRKSESPNYPPIFIVSAPDTSTTTTLPPTTTTPTTTLPPPPPSRGARLTVSVLDEATRRPVPNMRVDLTPLVGWKTFLRGSDRMVFEGLPPDSYSVTAEAEGYTSGSDRVTVTKQQDYLVVIWLKKKEEGSGPAPHLTARLDCGGSFELAPGASKSCGVIVEGWRSNTADRVEVVFFPNPPPEGITVFPGNTSEDPGNMHSTSASDYYNRYVFSQGFQAKDNATPGTRQFQITVRQRDSGSVTLTLNVAVLKKGLLPSTGPGIRPPVTGGTGSGGEWCVWRYKPFGSPPQCFGFDEAPCTSPRHNNPRNGYELERPNMTRYEAHALATQLSSYYDDKYACHAGTTLPSPAPPAQQTGSLTADLDCGGSFELAPGAFDGKNCGIVVRGWRSNTTERVEVEVVHPRESSGIEASPGSTSQDPGNMHSTSASDYYNRYVFGQTFRAKDNAPPGVTPIRITVRQRGTGQVDLTLNVAVLKKGLLPSTGPGIRPPVTGGTGSGGEWCVWRYKPFGSPPQCFGFDEAPCTSPRHNNPRNGYELERPNMTRYEAHALATQLSSYYDDKYACRTRTTLPPTPTTTTTLPRTTTTTPTTTTTLPPPPPPQRVLSRFGVFPYRVTLKVGETRSFNAYGVYSGGDPDKPVDLTGKANWPQGRVFTAKEPGEYTVTATFEGASGTATVTVVEDEKKGPTDDGGKKPPDIKGATEKGTTFQGQTPGGKPPEPTSGAAGGGQPVEQPGQKPPAGGEPPTTGPGGPAGPGAGQGVWCYSEKTKEQYWLSYGPCPPPWIKPRVGWKGLVPGRETPGTGTKPPPQKPSAPPPTTTPTTLPPAKTPPTPPPPGPTCGPATVCKCADGKTGHIPCDKSKGKCHCGAG